MKQIVSALSVVQVPVVELGKLDDVYGLNPTSAYVGFNEGGGDGVRCRGFVVQAEYNKGNFVGLAAYRVTKGNRWYPAAPTLPALVAKLLADGFSVYLFDTPERLFLWLSNGKLQPEGPAGAAE